MIKHNLDVIKKTDWIIVWGRKAAGWGDVALGTPPEQVAARLQNHTWRFLALALGW